MAKKKFMAGLDCSSALRFIKMGYYVKFRLFK